MHDSINCLFSELVPRWSAGIFTIENFSQVRMQAEPLYGPTLARDGVVWRLKVYPNGNGAVRGEFLSVFLEMTAGRSEASTYVSFTLFEPCIFMKWFCVLSLLG